jgi:hypothetical protein
MSSGMDGHDDTIDSLLSKAKIVPFIILCSKLDDCCKLEMLFDELLNGVFFSVVGFFIKDICVSYPVINSSSSKGLYGV